jgi:hypothetical protein
MFSMIVFVNVCDFLFYQGQVGLAQHQWHELLLARTVSGTVYTVMPRFSETERKHGINVFRRHPIIAAPSLIDM